MHVEPGLGDGAIGVVELGGLGEMCDVAGMNHERRFCGQRFDLPDRFLKRADRIGVGWGMEADMTIADLQEGQLARLGRQRSVDNAERARHAAGNRPKHPRTRPRHAFQHLAAVEAVAVCLVAVGFHHQSPI